MGFNGPILFGMGMSSRRTMDFLTLIASDGRHVLPVLSEPIRPLLFRSSSFVRDRNSTRGVVLQGLHDALNSRSAKPSLETAAAHLETADAELSDPRPSCEAHGEARGGFGLWLPGDECSSDVLSDRGAEAIDKQANRGS